MKKSRRKSLRIHTKRDPKRNENDCRSLSEREESYRQNPDPNGLYRTELPRSRRPVVEIRELRNLLEKKAQVTPRISESASKNLTFMSKELAQGLKSSDYMTIEVLSEQDESFESLVEKLQARDSEISEADVQTSLRILDQSFLKKEPTNITGRLLLISNITANKFN